MLLLSLTIILASNAQCQDRDSLFGPGAYNDLRTYPIRYCNSVPCSGLKLDSYSTGVTLQAAYYRKGKLHGTIEAYHPSGNIRYKGQLRNNLRKGLWVWIYESGELMAVNRYTVHHILPYFEAIYYENGQLKTMIKRKRQNGKVTLVKKYDEKGELILSITKRKDIKALPNRRSMSY